RLFWRALQNGDAGVSSEVEIRGVNLVKNEPEAPVFRPPARLVRPTDEMLARAESLPLDRMVSASAVSFQRESDGVIGRSLPTPWAYISKLDLGAASIASGGWVAVELRVKSGNTGIGVENRTGDDFLTRRFIRPSESFQWVYLYLDSYCEAG